MNKTMQPGRTNTHVLSNATTLPPEPINNLTHAGGPIVDPRHVVVDGAPDVRVADALPDGAKDAPSRGGTVLGHWVVVLLWFRQ